MLNNYTNNLQTEVKFWSKSKPRTATEWTISLRSRRRWLSVPAGGAVGYFESYDTLRPKKNIFQPSRGHCLLLVLLWEIYSKLSILDAFKGDRGYTSAFGIYFYVLGYCGIAFIWSELSS